MLVGLRLSLVPSSNKTVRATSPLPGEGSPPPESQLCTRVLKTPDFPIFSSSQLAPSHLVQPLGTSHAPSNRTSIRCTLRLFWKFLVGGYSCSLLLWDFPLLQLGKLGKVLKTQAFDAVVITTLATGKTSVCVFFLMKHCNTGFQNPTKKVDEERKTAWLMWWVRW